MPTSIIEQALWRQLEESWALWEKATLTVNVPLMGLRLAALARSNAWLWTEAGLQAQERAVREVPRAPAVARSVLLGTVTADIALGYLGLRERARVWPGLVSPADWAWQHQRGANRLLDTAAALGGALIKACQFAASRPDLLPPIYVRTLAPLQDRMPPLPWPEIAGAIADALGQRPEALFAEIDPEPIAAASIAQVHRARLPDGRVVAVKVQYPGIDDLVATDLGVLERVVKLVARFVPAIQLQPILDYLQQTLPLELDFRHEAQAMTELRAALAGRRDVLVPTVVPELSGRCVLVMDYVEGIKITDRAALEAAGIPLPAVARLLNDVYAAQILHLGILHADPHPGNLLVQPGPRLVLLDHGLTVPLPPALRGALCRIVQALTSLDFAALAAALADAGVPLDRQADISTLLALVGVVLGEEELGGALAGGTALQAGFQLGKSLGRIPTDLLLVGRALGLLDGITRQLDPTLNTLDLVAHYT